MQNPRYQKVLLAILALLLIASYLLPPALQNALNEELLSFSVAGYQFSLFRILQTIILILVALTGIRVALDLFERAISKRGILRASSRILIKRILQVVLYFLLFTIILSNLGIDLTALAVLHGAIGVGIGFGLQKIASNFISGIILTSENVINEGDLLELSDGAMGYVRRLGARQILMEGFDGKEYMVPNEEFINNRVVNWTYSSHHARVEVAFGVAYGSDLRQVQEIALEIARNHEHCQEEPPPACHCTEFADSSINFSLMMWIRDVNHGVIATRSQILLQLWEKLAEADITIPFPQRDIHVIGPEMPEQSDSAT